MDAITTNCPGCHAPGKVPETFVGRQVKCRKCGQPFTVTRTANPPSAAPAEPAATPAAPETIEIRCGGCAAIGKAPVAFAGRQVKCRKCGQPVQVAPSGPTAPPPAPEIAASQPESLPEDPGLLDDVGLAPMPGEEDVDEDSSVLEGGEVIIDVVCPGCGKEGHLSERFVGKKINCQRCGQRFAVTDPSKPPKPLPPKQPKPAVAAPRRLAAETMDGRKTPDTVEEPLPPPTPVRKKGGPADPPWLRPTAVAENPAEAFNFAALSFAAGPAVAEAPAAGPAVQTAPAAASPRAPTKSDAPASAPAVLDLATLAAAGLALTVSWLPVVGGAGILCAIVGLVLGVFGLIRAASRPPGRFAWPAAGTATSALGLILSLVLTFGAESEQPPPQEVARTTPPANPAPPPPDTNPAFDVPPPDPKPDPIPEKKPEPPPEKKPDPVVKNPDPVVEKKPDPVPEKKPDPIPQKPPEPPPVVWVDVTKSPVRIGDVQVRVTQVHIDPIRTKDRVTTERYLNVRIDVENLGVTEKAAYRGWGAGKPPAEGDVVRLVAPGPKPVERLLVPNAKLAAQPQDVVIGPGQTVNDLVLFPALADKVEFLRIELPASYVGAVGVFRLEIPGSMIAPFVPDKAPKDAPPAEAEDAKKLRELRAGLKNKAPAIRIESLNGLGKLGVAALPAFGDITKATKDRDESVRVAAVRALGDLGPAGKEAVPTLIEGLKDEFWKVRAVSAQALGKIGPDAKDAVPLLTQLLKSTDDEVPQQAAAALRLIQGAKPKK
jgi:uncharacterized protein (DUF983 family)